MLTYIDHSFEEEYNINVSSYEKELLLNFCKEARTYLRENKEFFGNTDRFDHNLDYQLLLIIENLEAEEHIDVESILKVINHYTNLKDHQNKRNGGG